MLEVFNQFSFSFTFRMGELQFNMSLLMADQPTWYMELKLALNVSPEH